jgi:hypothetical protein
MKIVKIHGANLATSDIRIRAWISQSTIADHNKAENRYVLEHKAVVKQKPLIEVVVLHDAKVVLP